MEEIKRETGMDEMEGIGALFEKLAACHAEDKPTKKINIVVTVDGVEESNLELETLFFVGIHSGGVSNDGSESSAAMAAGVVGRYDRSHSRHMRSQILKMLEKEVNA
jgi:hypothetical protein